MRLSTKYYISWVAMVLFILIYTPQSMGFIILFSYLSLAMFLAWTYKEKQGVTGKEEIKLEEVKGQWDE